MDILFQMSLETDAPIRLTSGLNLRCFLRALPSSVSSGDPTTLAAAPFRALITGPHLRLSAYCSRVDSQSFDHWAHVPLSAYNWRA